MLKAKQVNADGSLYNWNYNYHNNPYWLVYNNPEGDSRDNIVGSGAALFGRLGFASAIILVIYLLLLKALGLLDSAQARTLLPGNRPPRSRSTGA